MKASAIIVAAGSGRRLGRTIPKAFVEVAGRTMLVWAIQAVAPLEEIVEAVVAVPHGMEAAAQKEASEAAPALPIKVTRGGTERQDSVRIALELTSAEADLVVVHDAARPLAGPELFRQCLEAATRSGGAIAAIAVADTLKRVSSGRITSTLPRMGLWRAQTPQAFLRGVLLEAHLSARREGIVATDDADLVERIGGPVEIVAGSPLNLKITTEADLLMAERLAPQALRR